MTAAEKALLDTVRAAIDSVKPELQLDAREWEQLLLLAQDQELLPLVYDAASGSADLRSLDFELRRKYLDKATSLAIRQVMQSNEFLTLILHAQALGLDPIVLKGITVRSLYPKPMLRPSVDEDLLVAPEEAAKYHRFFLSEGLVPDDPEADLSSAYELSYHKPESPTYIELHLSPFSRDSDAYGDCNRLFVGASDRAVRVQVEDVSLRMLAPTDHLLYLICHAYKHFLHSGVGLRQVCDMGMFTERYGAEIDWARIVRDCASIRIDRFAAALFRISEQYLGFPMPELLSRYDVDVAPLLEDILTGGVYGITDENRLHSGTITLDAVAAQKRGTGRRGVIASLFPPVSSLAGRYPFLRNKPWLLPAAWTLRLFGYLRNHRTSALASVQIGEKRIDLLRQYGILD